MNAELLAYLKEFDPDDYWAIDFVRYPALAHFINEYKQNPEGLNDKFQVQKEVGINKKIDFLIAEFLRSNIYHNAFGSDTEREMFVYKLTKRLQ